MKGILQKIVATKNSEVSLLKSRVSAREIMASATYARSTYSMKNAIAQGAGIIAEFKRASPSKGSIRQEASVARITRDYMNAGASGISVLTDMPYFKGSAEDLIEARSAVSIPILRKEFIIDPIQIYESKAIGADCILLIAAILSSDEIKEFNQIASDTGLDVLVEVHNEAELDKLSGKEELIGINNRNLDTFEVDIENSIRLASQLPEAVKIAESGLGNNDNIEALIKAGFNGFLIGESFMKAADPGIACANFVQKVKASK